ncbi:flap endonuclease GEN [Bicyclus anynana]|uniref:Flap endonuclease GEN n=1 Tax=Bicyclus anynana TaxID=110368 RepID=A0ABM3LE56_BICAN|nr:flap endonuclease GEN [Bicyclus anynana]
MGIKGLWGVLNPYSEKKALHEIRGETVAVDLAGWVCDSQNVTEYYIQPKLYLRNLSFRTIYLILADINPVFVLEGDAPELKRDVMAARNAIQFKGAAPKTAFAKGKVPNVTRKRFKGVLKECETLLRSMGVRCVKGRGEAEATCARLNAKGVVNAVVSQDSDCFAYGAKRVYRNFSVSSAAGGGALQGSVDCYDADKMYRSNGFGRKKMVALALLCGCDYGVGACGSSITTVVSFLHTVPEEDVIPRLLSWVSDPEDYAEKARWMSAPGRCDRCGHVGRTHARNGCPVCVTHKGCTDLGHKSKVAEVKREVSLRNRALSCGMPFPEPKVMKEFMNATPEDIDLDSLNIPTPSLIQFVKIMTYKLDWSEKYCVEKFLPLLTKWHLQENVPNRTLKPIEIKKKRNPRGVPSFEVLWKDIDGQYEALIPDDQFEEGEDINGPWTSVERQDLMRQYYPDLVEKYEESIKKPPKEKKTKGRKKKDNPDKQEQTDKPKRKYIRKPKQLKDLTLSELNESLKILNITNKDFNSSSCKANVSVSINKLKRKLKNPAKSKTKNTIDNYLQPRKKRKSSKLMQSLGDSFRNLSLVNNESLNLKHFDASINKENLKDNKHLLSMFDMTKDDVDENDLSAIVDDIISKATVTSANVNVNNKSLDLNNFDASVNKENLKDNKHLLSMFDMAEDDVDENDLSAIVDDIISRATVTSANVNVNNKSLDLNNFDASVNKENLKDNKHLLSLFDMTEDDVDENDLSAIVDDIISRAPTVTTAKVNSNFVKLIFEKNHLPRKSILTQRFDENNCSTPKNSPVRKSIHDTNAGRRSSIPKANTSYFFDKFTDECDAFEMSVEYKQKIACINLDSDATLEYSLLDV